MIDIIKPKRPCGPGWVQLPPLAEWALHGLTREAWIHRENRFSVLTAVEVAEAGRDQVMVPHWHISISTWNGAHETRRCDSSGALWVLSEFGMLDGEEDNHVPGGQVRNFWRPVADNLVGIDCACKADEPAVVEDRGDYVWRGVTR